MRSDRRTPTVASRSVYLSRLTIEEMYFTTQIGYPLIQSEGHLRQIEPLLWDPALVERDRHLPARVRERGEAAQSLSDILE
jgi:hypothetical protein